MSEIRANIINSEDGTAAVQFPKGQVVTGVTTATTFAGAGTNLTGLPAGQLTGALPALNAAALTALNASNIASGIVTAARLGGGTANATTFLNGNGQYTEAGGGKILQFVDGVTNSKSHVTSTDWEYINHYLTITPVKSDSTLLFQLAVGVQRENTQTGVSFGASIDDGSSIYWASGGGDYGWHDSGGQSNDMYWVEGPFTWTTTAGTAGTAETHKIYVHQDNSQSTGYDVHTRSSFICWEIAA